MIEDIEVKWDEMKVTCDSCGEIIYLRSSPDDILVVPVIAEYIKWSEEHDKHNAESGYSISTYRDKDDEDNSL